VDQDKKLVEILPGVGRRRKFGRIRANGISRSDFHPIEIGERASGLQKTLA
jgi:hypothetical protein